MDLSRGQLPRISQDARANAPATFEVPFNPPSLGEAHAIWDGTTETVFGQLGVQVDEVYPQPLGSTRNLNLSNPDHPLPGDESLMHNVYHPLPPELATFTPGEHAGLTQGLSENSFQFHPPSDYVMYHVEDPEAAVLWENFLREAGIGA